MSDTAIHAALKALIPSLPATNKPIPQLLLSQAESLLSQSRQRASHLKPEEEIARPHACAEIACTRLRAQLRLPAIKNGAGAPCNPRVYAKLLKYLEGVLGDGNTGSSTPRGKKRDGAGNLKDAVSAGSGRKTTGTPKRGTNVEGTPTKKRPVREEAGKDFAGTVESRQKPRSKGLPADDDKAPYYVMPSTRKLCKTFSTPSMVPHIYTGTCVTLELSKIWSPGDDLTDALQGDIASLVVALYLMVLTRMQTDQMTTEVYTQILEKSVAELKLNSSTAEVVEEWINRLNEEGWCSGQDWWDSVPESVLEFDLDATGEDSGHELADELDVVNSDVLRSQTNTARKIELDEKDPDGILLPGLGTMFHAGIDWTGEDMRLDYAEWHANFIKKLNKPATPIGKKQRMIRAQ